ncbi:MAG: hypothetical protein LBQ22_11900 [Bacteroidales bacterium]|jgi:hypothetical protein|nr:hypothetical protein [Bacteroidales bacterium]
MEELFLQAITDQKEELAIHLQRKEWISRKQEKYINLKSNLAQIIIRSQAFRKIDTGTFSSEKYQIWLYKF